MVAERIRNRTSLAMLCYAMLWMDPVFLEPIAISVSSIFPNCPISHLPACAARPAWPMQTRCPIYNLPPSLPPSIPHSLPYQSPFHFIPLHFSVQPAKRGQSIESLLSVCPSAIDRSLIPFLSYPWIRIKPRGHGWEKNMVRHEDSLSLSLSVRPFVRVKDSFLSYPFHS